MRGGWTISLLVHGALLSMLFVTRPHRTIALPGPDLVRVALVDASQIPSAPAPAPAPPPDEQGVRLPDMKPKPVAKPVVKPVAKKTAAVTKPAPAATPATTTLEPARVGAAGLVGSMGVDAADFPFSYYLSAVRDRIAANWQPPAGLATGGAPLKATVYFRIVRSGNVVGARLETASGTEYFDRAALRAVMLSDPMPPLPAGFPEGDLGVHFGFEWESP
jgi:TonB family protein